MLDTHTLMIVSLMTSGIIGTVLLLTWWINRSMAALGYWALAFYLYTGGIAEIALRSLKELEIWNILGVLLLGSAHLCVLFGTRTLTRKSIPWTLAGLLLAVMVATWLYFYLVQPSFRLRYASYSLISALIAGIGSIELFRVERDRWLSALTLLGAIYGLMAVTNLVRGTLGGFGLISESIQHVGVMQTQQFLQANILLVTIGICMVVVSTERLQSELRRSAIYDRLTGIFNRGAFVDLAEGEFARWLRSGTSFSVLLMDLDHFKRINDQYGHPAGDAVLIAFARLCTESLRNGDLLGRYGGEEFCALLPGTDRIQAEAVAERLRRNTADMTVEWQGMPLSLGVSIGVAEVDGRVSNFDGLIARADAALYQAKDAGRNRVVVAQSLEMLA